MPCLEFCFQKLLPTYGPASPTSWGRLCLREFTNVFKLKHLWKRSFESYNSVFQRVFRLQVLHLESDSSRSSYRSCESANRYLFCGWLQACMAAEKVPYPNVIGRIGELMSLWLNCKSSNGSENGLADAWSTLGAGRSSLEAGGPVLGTASPV